MRIVKGKAIYRLPPIGLLEAVALDSTEPGREGCLRLLWRMGDANAIERLAKREKPGRPEAYHFNGRELCLFPPPESGKNLHLRVRYYPPMEEL